MIEAITSLIDNYKRKIRNPLIGTMISVWLIHNWKIVFVIFNFETNHNLDFKINYIQNYFSKRILFYEIWQIAWISFVIIFVTFIFLGISRLITNGYYKVLEPFLIGIIQKKEIFTLEEKKKLESEIKNLKVNIDQLKDTSSKSENQNTYLRSKIIDIEKKYDEELLDISEKIRKAEDSYELLETKNERANKIITFFDDIINNLSVEIKKELKIFMENKKNPNSSVHTNFIGLQTVLLKLGILVKVDGEIKNPALGLLFLEYYKDFHGPLTL
jgi:hypothetical protein